MPGSRVEEVLARLDIAVAGRSAPLAALDLAAYHANGDDLVRRAGGVPLRLASKSIRCRWVLRDALAATRARGLMAYTVAEANWLAGEQDAGEQVADDVLVAYPSTDVDALRALAADDRLLGAITVMVDSVEGVNLLRAATGSAPVRVCLDVDASLRVGPAHLGVRRSPLRTESDVAAVAQFARRSGFDVVGIMFYEAQIAGLQDSSPAVRLVKRRSAAELAERRGRLAHAVRDAIGGPLQFVNSGGTGSLEISGSDPNVTEVTAGSGLYCPALFDGYDCFEPRPAMFFALPVARRPGPGFVTLSGGGYIASGPAGKSRLPSLVTPDLKLLGTEGAGEVQTPVTGKRADSLSLGELVWFRHAKAGELLERFDTVLLVDEDRVVDEVPSYRGEGKNFG